MNNTVVKSFLFSKVKQNYLRCVVEIAKSVLNSMDTTQRCSCVATFHNGRDIGATSEGSD